MSNLRFETPGAHICRPLLTQVPQSLSKTLLSIPGFLLAMGVADFLYCGSINWKNLGFVLRNALIEHSILPSDSRNAYQRILFSVWIWSYMVLISSYSGNLTAMLANPSLQTPIRTLQELLSQNAIPWVIETGGLPEFFMSTAQSGTVMKRVFERSTMMPRLDGPCYTDEVKKDGRFGSICDRSSIRALFDEDYSKTGKCNYYLLEEKFLPTIGALAIQVQEMYVYK